MLSSPRSRRNQLSVIAAPIELPRALTQLSEDELLFQQSVRDFARDRIAPKVREMDESQHFDTSLLKQLFELGLTANVSLLSQDGITTCATSCHQTYSCNGTVVGQFTINKTFSKGTLSGQPITNVIATKF